LAALEHYELMDRQQQASPSLLARGSPFTFWAHVSIFLGSLSRHPTVYAYGPFGL
jgi:hypothetical protein